MDNYFAKKVVWITGASSGIGEALALQFANMGAYLVLSARREEELLRVANLCQENGAETFVLPLDLSAMELFSTKEQEVLKRFGQIDILIHNAGISCYGRVAKVPFAVEKELFEVNFLSTVALTKTVLPTMLEKGTGQIVAIASALAYLEYPERAAYSASKHAMLGYFHSLGLEIEKEGLKATVVCPGFVKTSLGKKALNEEGKPTNIDNPGQLKGMSAERCAQKIIRAIRQGKREVYIGSYEPWMIRLRRFFPGLYFGLLSYIWTRWHKKLKKKI